MSSYTASADQVMSTTQQAGDGGYYQPIIKILEHFICGLH